MRKLAIKINELSLLGLCRGWRAMASTEPKEGDAATKKRHYSVLFVCWGNICRSPIAETVFNKVLDERGIADRWTVDSAGTGEWNIGDPPDPRAQKTLRQESGIYCEFQCKN